METNQAPNVARRGRRKKIRGILYGRVRLIYKPRRADNDDHHHHNGDGGYDCDAGAADEEQDKVCLERFFRYIRPKVAATLVTRERDIFRAIDSRGERIYIYT